MTEQHPPASGLPEKDRMIPASSLEWGQTPFDNLSRGELLRLVQAYHVALQSAVGVVEDYKFMSQRLSSQASSFWEADGRGGRALSRAEKLLHLAGEDEDSGNIYQSFFRVGTPMLFGPESAFDEWGIDPKTGEMCAPYHRDPRFRAVEWSDLLPQTKNDAVAD